MTSSAEFSNERLVENAWRQRNEALSPLFEAAQAADATHVEYRAYGRTRFLVPSATRPANAGLNVFLERHVRAALRCHQWWLRLNGGHPQSFRESPLLEDLKSSLDVKGAHSILSVGTPGPHRKNTVLFVDAKGGIGPIVKVATAPAAVTLLRNEQAWLQRLGNEPRLRGSVPRVLFSGERHGMFFLAQSCRVGRRGGRRSSPRLSAFLEELQLHLNRRDSFIGSRMHLNLRRRSHSLSAGLSERWGALIENATGHVEARLADKATPMVVVHGDFAPWNVRLCAGQPWIFDWEYATDGYIPEYDRLHYCLQPLAKNALLDERDRRRAIALARNVAASMRPTRNSFDAAVIAYFLDVALNHIEREDTADTNSPLVRNYLTLISELYTHAATGK